MFVYLTHVALGANRSAECTHNRDVNHLISRRNTPFLSRSRRGEDLLKSDNYPRQAGEGARYTRNGREFQKAERAT